MMEQLLAMLKESYPLIDFENQKQLMTDGILDSIAVVAIIAAIEDMFDISVTMEYIQPDYFESVETMWEMIEELQ
ncbi:MAG: acyl carrier protein [Ruminococcaceae bacterium]|nr:acyl carrier protein [Oscillospiraceae bacterium]